MTGSRLMVAAAVASVLLAAGCTDEEVAAHKARRTSHARQAGGSDCSLPIPSRTLRCQGKTGRPAVKRARPAPSRHADLTLSPATRPEGAVQGYIDGSGGCRTAQFRRGRMVIVVGHGLEATGACGNRSTRWYRLRRGALIHVTRGPGSGWYRVTGHARSHDAPGHTATTVPGSVTGADLALASCLTDTDTGWTITDKES